MTPWRTRVRRSLSRLRGQSRSGGLILVYHRIADPIQDPLNICVPPRLLAAHLGVVSAWAAPLPLDEFVDRALADALPDRAVAVTFDDGYRETLTTALPVLESFGVPATLFTITGRFGQTLWWDQLTRLILTPSELPEALLLPDGTPVTSANQERSEIFHLFFQALQQLPPTLQERTLALLSEQIDVPDSATAGRSLTANELRQLAAHELIAIGAHTFSHVNLAALPLRRQAEEIVESRRILESILGRPVSGFSYPHGRLAPSYTAETVQLVRTTGFSYACTSTPGVTQAQSDPFQLPRLRVGAWEADEFQHRLAEWLPPA